MAIDPRPSIHRPPAALVAIALASVLAAPLVTTGCGGTADPVSHPEGTAPGGALEGAPVNASPEASVQPPSDLPPRTPPPPLEVEPRSEWTIDESIPTPDELRGLEILAKFKKGADVVVIYQARNGDVYRRVQGQLGSFTLVDESKIELEPEP